MARILTLFLMLHWSAVFSLIAALSIMDLGAVNGLNAFGVDIIIAGLNDAQTLLFRAVVGFAFMICAVLFWWSFATLILSLRDERSQGDDVLRVAFSAAACLMTLILVAGAAAHVDRLLPVMATHIAALTASYVAIQGELGKIPLASAAREDALRLAVRIPATDASRLAVLGRLVPNLHILERLKP